MVASAVVFSAAFYVAVIVLLFLVQRSLLYLPGGLPGEPAAAGVPEMRVVTLRTGDGLDLLAWHAPPSGPSQPTLALFHGNGGHIGLLAGKARVFIDAGYGLLLPEYRGYGGNPGRPTEEGLYADARAALDWLAGRGVAGDDLVLYGESLGSGVAVQMATERRAAALVLEAPYTSIPDVGATRYPWAPVRFLTLDRFDSLAKIKTVEAPLLVVHGGDDQVVPFRLGQRLFDAAREPKQAHFLPLGGHGDLYTRGAGEAILAFLGRAMMPSAGSDNLSQPDLLLAD